MWTWQQPDERWRRLNEKLLMIYELERFKRGPSWLNKWDNVRWVEKALDDASRAAEMMLWGNEENAMEKKPKWKGFANVAVPMESLAEFLKWKIKPEEFYGELEIYLREGYKLGLYGDSRNNSITASMTCNILGDDNAGWTLTATGPSWFEALKFLVWKHEHVAKGAWMSEDSQALGSYT